MQRVYKENEWGKVSKRIVTRGTLADGCQWSVDHPLKIVPAIELCGSKSRKYSIVQVTLTWGQRGHVIRVTLSQPTYTLGPQA